MLSGAWTFTTVDCVYTTYRKTVLNVHFMILKINMKIDIRILAMCK